MAVRRHHEVGCTFDTSAAMSRCVGALILSADRPWWGQKGASGGRGAMGGCPLRVNVPSRVRRNPECAGACTRGRVSRLSRCRPTVGVRGIHREGRARCARAHDGPCGGDSEKVPK